MNDTYRVVIKGVRDGFTKEQVISQLAALFKITEGRIPLKTFPIPILIALLLTLPGCGGLKTGNELGADASVVSTTAASAIPSNFDWSRYSPTPEKIAI